MKWLGPAILATGCAGLALGLLGWGALVLALALNRIFGIEFPL